MWEEEAERNTTQMHQLVKDVGLDCELPDEKRWVQIQIIT